MTPSMTALLVCAVLVAFSLLVRKHSMFWIRSINHGAESIRQWLPVLCFSLFVLLVMGNIAGRFDANPILDLDGFLNRGELLLLLLITPLLLFNTANMISLFILSYLFAKIVFNLSTTPDYSGAVFVLLACLGILTSIGDRYPWQQKNKQFSYGERIRTVLMLAVSLVAVTTLLIAMFKAQGFTSWFIAMSQIAIAPQIVLIGLAALLVGWFLIAFRMSHPLLLFVLAAPTAIVQMYMMEWPTAAVAVMLACTIALALTPEKEYLVVTHQNPSWQ